MSTATAEVAVSGIAKLIEDATKQGPPAMGVPLVILDGKEGVKASVTYDGNFFLGIVGNDARSVSSVKPTIHEAMTDAFDMYLDTLLSRG